MLMNIDASEDWEYLAELCPSGAIAMDSREYSVKEVMEEIRKDMVFYRHGGGVTLSGGEKKEKIAKEKNAKTGRCRISQTTATRPGRGRFRYP